MSLKGRMVEGMAGRMEERMAGQMAWKASRDEWWNASRDEWWNASGRMAWKAWRDEWWNASRDEWRGSLPPRIRLYDAVDALDAAWTQCFLVQNQAKYLLDTLIQKIFSYIMKINIFWGELTENSAKTEALLGLLTTHSRRSLRQALQQHLVSPRAISILASSSDYG